MKRIISVKFQAFVAGSVMGVTMLSTVIAYEVTTHRTMTRLAIMRSQLGVDTNLLWHLGIGVDSDSAFLEQRLRYTDDEGLYRDISPAYMLEEGAELEDDGTRVTRHFFDPISGGSISLFGVEQTPSPDWSLEPEVSSSQDWSYRDMMEALNTAMISTNEQDSYRRFATAFRRLGHVVHHVQDMAQPQHARLDIHCNSGALCWGDDYEPSFYEWLSAGMSNGGFRSMNGDLVIRPSDPGDYPNVHLYRTRDYWHQDSGLGIADYSNSNFVTEDTNFVLDEDGNVATAGFASPGLADWVEITVDGATLKDAAGNPLQGDLKVVRAPVTDTYLEMAPAWTHDTSSQTLFSTDIRQAIDEGVSSELFDEHEAVFYLNRINLESANRHLYQRAIGYSAGFIDHVFRGRLEIVPPDDGVYSLVDHAVINEVGGDVPEGFTSIRLKLRNATTQQSSPDSLVAADGHVIKAGKLVAVALFRPNPCYTPDLKGERDEEGVIPNGCELNEWRRTEQHRVVSAEIDLPGGLSTMEFSSFTFDFSANPIPMNARDLSIQVIFRGELGGDSDAFAVARKDISEPTWIGAMNSTDYFGVDGDFQPTDTFLASPEAAEWGIDTELERRDWGRQRVTDIAYFNQRTGERLTDWIPLEEHQYFRLATLVEPNEFFWVDVVVFLEHMHYSKSIGFPPARISLEENPEVVTIPGFGDMTRLVRRWTTTAIPSFRGASGIYIDAEHLWVGAYPTFEDGLTLPDAPDVGNPQPAGVSGGMQ